MRFDKLNRERCKLNSQHHDRHRNIIVDSHMLEDCCYDSFLRKISSLMQMLCSLSSYICNFESQVTRYQNILTCNHKLGDCCYDQIRYRISSLMQRMCRLRSCNCIIHNLQHQHHSNLICSCNQEVILQLMNRNRKYLIEFFKIYYIITIQYQNIYYN